MGTKSVMTVAEQEEVGKLIAQAYEEGDLKAIAAIVAPPIELEISRREITSLLLTKVDLKAGEPATFQMAANNITAKWISKDGDVCESEVKGDEVEFPFGKAVALPMVDTSTLKHGNIGKLSDILKKAGKQIRIIVDQRTISLLSAAVPVANTVECSGGKLTREAMSKAKAFIEDQELAVKYILMRGSRAEDMEGWELDQATRREMMLKGIFKIYNGAEIIFSASMLANEVILLGDDEVGKYAIRTPLTTDVIEEKKRFKTGWLAWLEAALGITNPAILAKVVITA